MYNLKQDHSVKDLFAELGIPTVFGQYILEVTTYVKQFDNPILTENRQPYNTTLYLTIDESYTAIGQFYYIGINNLNKQLLSSTSADSFSP